MWKRYKCANGLVNLFPNAVGTVQTVFRDELPYLIEVGVRQGATSAHIELSPASLGTIRIQLQHTADGVTAKVVTDHAATADTLSQGGDDLRRSLQSAGVNLVSLDIEARGDGPTQDQANNNPTPDSAPNYTSGDGETDDAVGDVGQIESSTVALTGSARVNVLA